MGTGRLSVVKICRICELEKPLDEFGSHASHKDGKQNYCKACRNLENRRLLTPEQKANKAKNQIRYAFKRNVHRRNMRYGVTPQQFEAMKVSQGGVCAICGESETYEHKDLCVDHDHNCCPGFNGCGKCVRGLLCSRCNKALGGFRDDPVLLANALDYLTRPVVKTSDIKQAIWRGVVDGHYRGQGLPT